MSPTPERKARQDIGAALQAARWIVQDRAAMNLAAGLNPPVHPLPFLYLSTGIEARFINGLDPDPKTRTISANLPHIHRPATLAEWIGAETLDGWVKRLHADGGGLYTAADEPASVLLERVRAERETTRYEPARTVRKTRSKKAGP